MSVSIDTDYYVRPFHVYHRKAETQGGEGQSRLYGLANALRYVAALIPATDFEAGGYVRLEVREEATPEVPGTIIGVGGPEGLELLRPRLAPGQPPVTLTVLWRNEE